MHLTELKQKPVSELMDMAREMSIDNVGRSRKQEVIAAIVRKQAKSGEDIYGEGTLEILQDGFGFLRSPDSSYLAGPDDIYVSPSQVRRFNLRTGDSIAGKIRPPKDGERYFALLKVDEIKLDNSLPTLIYNYYNLDPNWRKNEKANRVLIFEPKIFREYPVSQKCLDFSINLSKNINDIQIFFGDIDLLKSNYGVSKFIFKEHLHVSCISN